MFGQVQTYAYTGAAEVISAEWSVVEYIGKLIINILWSMSHYLPFQSTEILFKSINLSFFLQFLKHTLCRKKEK
jgi:hypothetical protein